jgi:hypothetical protein
MRLKTGLSMWATVAIALAFLSAVSAQQRHFLRNSCLTLVGIRRMWFALGACTGKFSMRCYGPESIDAL